MAVRHLKIILYCCVTLHWYSCCIILCVITYSCITCTTLQSLAIDHGVGVWVCLRFPQPWKYSSAVAFPVDVTLPDCDVRVQEYATRSSLHDYSRFGERIFPRSQGGQTYGRFPKVNNRSSELLLVSSILRFFS